MLMITVSVLIPRLCCSSSGVEFEISDGETCSSSLTVQNILAILGFLCFHIQLRTVLSRLVKNCVGILMGSALNL